MRILIAALFLSLVAACDATTPSSASTTSTPAASNSLEVRDAWAAPTPRGVDVSAGYLTIINGAAASDRLVAASSPRAARVELHEMSMNGSVMQMRRVETLDIAAGETVTLGQGGRHLMFFGVTQPFAEGESIPVTLTFERAGEVSVTLVVRRGGAHAH